MAVLLVFTLAACGSHEDKSSDPTVPNSPVQTAEPTGEAGKTAQTEAETETRSTESEEVSGATESTESGTKALVVYFSATGNTKAVAETIAKLQGADIYEIVPANPYTEEDLNYNDRTTRATTEQNDPDARPAISEDVADMDQYEVIYVGYPIWWGDMPRILYTFFDTYDMAGKTIAPFCTSGGSGLSGTPGTIGELEPEAEVLDGLAVRDSGAESAEGNVTEWLAQIGLAE